MKSAWIVAVIVCVALTSAAFAQLSPRAMGMGNTGVGVANDGAAWFQNPAGLGALNLTAIDEKLWAVDVIGAFADSGDSDAFGITGAAWQPAKAMGFGAGFADFQDDDTTIGAGFGMAVKNSPLSLGINVYSIDSDAAPVVDDEELAAVSKTPGNGGSETFFDIGAMYQFPVPLKAPIRLGLVWRDVADNFQSSFDLGFAWPATEKLLVAVDILDIADDFGTGAMFNAGLEFKLGLQNEWTARIGTVDDGEDNNLTLGAGYALANNWRLDAAWVDTEGDSTWSVGAGVGF